MLVFKDLSYLNNDLHLAIMSELESIRLEAEQHLHDPLLVRIDQAAVFSQLGLTNVDETCEKLCLVVLCFPFLDQNHISHSLDDVKLLHVYSEFALLDLGEIQHVLDHKLEAERARLLHFDSIVQLVESKLAAHYQQTRLRIIFDLFLKQG